MAYVAGLGQHLASIGDLSGVKLVGSKLSKSIGYWPEDDLGAAACEVVGAWAIALDVLLDDEYGRDGWDLGQRRKLLQGRVVDERLDRIDFRPTVAVMDAADDELDVRMRLDAGRCGLPDDAEQIRWPHPLDAAESFLPLGD